jgi:sporulation protein YlmC with PRC-barrel domain
MRNLMMSCAAAALIAAPAFAQQSNTDQTLQPTERQATERPQLLEKEADNLGSDSGMTREGDMAQQGGATGDMMADRAPMVERDGWRQANDDEIAGLNAEALDDVDVYGVDDEEIGEIDDVVMGENGRIESLIVEVGGFLGIGEKDVAVPLDEVRLLKEQNGDNWRAYIDTTEEKLESMPEYEN